MLLRLSPYLIFPSCLFIVAAWWEHPLAVLAALLALSIVAIAVAPSRRVAGAMWLTAAVAGPTAEGIAIAAGAWTYAGPSQLAGVPAWLPPLWGLAGLFFLSAAGKLTARLTLAPETDH